MSVKTALVTGGTDGIGKEIARGLAAGHRVTMVGRDEAKGKRAVQEINETTGNDGITYICADLSLMAAVNRLADVVLSSHSELHYLVLGAGVVRGVRILTAEGIESTFALNFPSRFALSQRLLPLLQASGQNKQNARVLLLGGAAQSGKVYWDDVNLTRNFSTIRSVLQYCIANDVFTVEMDRRKGSSQVTFNCLKIGVVKTNIQREFPIWMKILVPLVFDPLVGQTSKEVAKSALSLLLDQQFAGVSGQLFLKIKRLKRIAAGRTASDPQVGARLFELSQRMIAEALRKTLSVDDLNRQLSADLSTRAQLL